MKVDREKAVRLVHGGRTYSFCSEDCLAQFAGNPGRYVGPATAAGGAAPAWVHSH
jgi:YHS domain-containing protein